MKFNKLNFIFACTMLLILNACNKESNTLVDEMSSVQQLEIKEYYPPEEVDVTEKVVGFLDHTKTHIPNARFKTEFKDMEVNEAMFTLEAASNYLVNKNFKYKADIEKEILNFFYELEISKQDRNFIISGETLTNTFDQLFADINSKIGSKSKLPKLVDFTIEKSDNNNVVFKAEVRLATNILLNINNNRVPSNSSCNNNRCSSGNTNSNYIFNCSCDTEKPPTQSWQGGLNDLQNKFGICITDEISQRNQSLWFTSVQTVSSNPDCQTAVNTVNGFPVANELHDYLECVDLVAYNGPRHIEGNYDAWGNIAPQVVDKINEELCNNSNGYRAIMDFDEYTGTTPPAYGYSAYSWWAITGLKMGNIRVCDSNVCW